MFKVNIHEYLNDNSVVDTKEFDDMKKAREFAMAQRIKRVPCTVYHDGRVVMVNYPNTYAMCPSDGMRAHALWNMPHSEEVEGELITLQSRQLY